MAASSRAALRGSGALGLALSWAATAATMLSRRRGSIGIARVSLAAPRPRDSQARARASPGQEIGSCETGLSWEMLWIAKSQSFPGPRPDVHGPPLWRVLAFLGFWVPAAPHDTPRIRRGSRSACTTESRRWKRGNRAWPDLGAIRQKLPPTRDLRLRGRSVQPAQTTDREGSHEPATPAELLSYKTVTDGCRHRDHQKRRGR